MEIKKYGKTEQIEISGRTITILPTCCVPIEHLDEDNWRNYNGKPYNKNSWNSDGHFRFVWRIRNLADDSTTALYAKHPERVFTTNRRLIEQDNPWWGGPKSGEKYVYIEHPLVEEQTFWQAIYLLELYKQGIPAEVPQAIVDFPDGKTELIVYDVEKYDYVAGQFPTAHEKGDLRERIEKLGFYPDDIWNNTFTNRHGGSTIIDVNRWTWSPHTDEWRLELGELVMKEVERRMSDSKY